MSSLIKYLLRLSITPLLIAFAIITAYFSGLVVNEKGLFILLIISGLIGQGIQRALEYKHNKNDNKNENEVKDGKNALSDLPEDVQELIREGEKIKEEIEEKKGKYSI